MHPVSFFRTMQNTFQYVCRVPAETTVFFREERSQSKKTKRTLMEIALRVSRGSLLVNSQYLPGVSQISKVPRLVAIESSHLYQSSLIHICRRSLLSL